MADNGSNVTIKIGADSSGADKVEKALDKIEKKAKQMTESTRAGFLKTEAAIGRVTKAAGMFNKVITGFGVVGVITSIVAGIASIIKSFGHAQKTAEEFGKIQKQLAEDKAIAKLANDYNRLTAAINASAKAQNHQLEIQDMQIANERKLAQAKLEAAKQAELAALDTNAGDYQERVQGIEARYAALGAAQQAQYAEQDVQIEQQKLLAQAQQAGANATAQDAKTKSIATKLAVARQKLATYREQSTTNNDQDKTGFWSAAGVDLKNVVTLNWGEIGRMRTKEGDAVRKEAAQNAAAADKEVMQLEEELRQSKFAAEELRKEQERLQQKAQIKGDEMTAVRIANQTSVSVAQRGEKTAQHAIADKQAEYSDAVASSELLQRQKQETQARIQAEEARRNNAQQQLFEAQSAYDLQRANGGKMGTIAQDLDAAKRNAASVDREASAMIASLTETLNKIEARLKAANTAIQTQYKQTRYAWSEQPAG